MADPEVSEAFVADARAAFQLFQNERVGEAKAICERLIAEGPPFRDISHLMGVLQMKQGNYKDAREHLEVADQLQPGVEDVVFQLALSLHQRSRGHWRRRRPWPVSPPLPSAYASDPGSLAANRPQPPHPAVQYQT